LIEGIVTFSTAFSVVTLNINNKGNKGGKRVPRLMRIIFFNYLARLFRIELTHNKKSDLRLIKESKEIKKMKRQEMLLREEHRHNTMLYENASSLNESLFNFQKSEEQSVDTVNCDDDDVHAMAKFPVAEIRPSVSDNFVLTTESTPIVRNYSESSYMTNGIAFDFLKFKDNSYYNINKLKETNANISNKNQLSTNSTIDQFYFGSKHLLNNSNNSSCKKSMPQQSSLTNADLSKFVKEFEKLLDKQFKPLTESIIKLKNEQDRKKNEKALQDVIKNEWRDVAMISDQIMCYIFSCLTVTSCLIIFLNSPHIMPISQW
jgi:hypothetical protein